MSSSKPVATPMTEGALREVLEVEGPHADTQLYQELLGFLLFISTRTRPDICDAVGIMCRFAANPNQVHWNCLKRILRYPRGTAEYAPRLGASDDVLTSYCDADWAADRVDRKSTTGVLVQLDSTTVVWRSIKQATVALSTTEAEYCSMSEGAKLVLWLRTLLKELNWAQKSATVMLGDNQGALVWSSDGIRHAKHVSIRMNFVKQQVDHSFIQLVYCPTEHKKADILTKALQNLAFDKHRDRMGVLNHQEFSQDKRSNYKRGR